MFMEQRIEQSVQRWRSLIPLSGPATLADLERVCRVKEVTVEYREGLPCAWYFHHARWPQIRIPQHYNEEHRYRALLEECGHHASAEDLGPRPPVAGTGPGAQRLDVCQNGRSEHYSRLWQAAWLLPVELVYACEPEDWLAHLRGSRELLEVRRHALAKLAERNQRLERHLLSLGRFAH